MASNKSLKKIINSVYSALFVEVSVLRMFLNKEDVEKTDAILDKISAGEEEMLSRSKHPGCKHNKKEVKEYYKKLKADFQQSVDGIIADIEAINK